MINRKLPPRLLGYAALLTLLACGGGGETVGPTIENPTVSITWPARTRDDGAIPAPGSALSAHVYIEGVNTGANCDVYITRDDNTSLHTGRYPIGQPWTHEPARITSTFFSGPNQTGDIVGVATGDVNATGNNFNLINFSLTNTVKSCKVIPPTTVSVGSTATQLLFEADGDQSTVVAVSPGSAKWTLVSGSGATLTPDGLLTATVAGTLTVKVTVDGIASQNTTITATEGSIGQVTFEDLSSADAAVAAGTASPGSGTIGGYFSYEFAPEHDRAAIWSNGERQDCHPTGMYSSIINAMDGDVGAGTISPNGSSFSAAIITHGGYVNLCPTDFSEALGISGSTEVGHKIRKACLWMGSAASYVDLHPSEWRESYATAISGSNIVGWVTSTPTIPGSKAVMWTGTDHTLAYLDPTGYSGSAAYAVSGNTEGGTFTQNDASKSIHACLWHGSADSVVDLNPSFAGGSQVLGLSNDVAVGWYVLPNNDQIYRACIWNGTSSHFVDLNAALGSSYITGSQALSVSPELGGYQVVGWAKSKEGETYGRRVIVWHVPSSLL
ncbi:MAG: hypothetical protein GC165_04455 [Armatimonadetes bacterium]|nr:hypothetical protein [Armatimonadota bacterium]